MDRLDAGLHRFVRKERRTVAAALHECHPRLHRIPGERVERELERPPHQAVNHETMLRGIDIRSARVRDHEMKSVRRERAVHEVVRGARMLRTRLTSRIGERPYDVLLEG